MLRRQQLRILELLAELGAVHPYWLGRLLWGDDVPWALRERVARQELSRLVEKGYTRKRWDSYYVLTDKGKEYLRGNGGHGNDRG